MTVVMFAYCTYYNLDNTILNTYLVVGLVGLNPDVRCHNGSMHYILSFSG